MAAITSAASGNWSAGSTWVGGVAPGNGDTATLAANHHVTVDVDVTIGTSPAAGTFAIRRQGTSATSNTGGRLTIAAGKTLRLRGDFTDDWDANAVNLDYALLTMQAGSKLIFDSSAAADPGGTAYRVRPGAANRPNHYIVCHGTPEAWCEITSDSGGANGWFADAGTFTRAGGWKAQYVLFSRIGSATNNAITYGVHPNVTYETLALELEHCKFDGCGRIHAFGPVEPYHTVRLVDVHFRNTLRSHCTHMLFTAALVTTGARLIKDSTFDKRLGQTAGEGGNPGNNDLTYENCFLVERPEFSGILSMKRTLVRSTSVNSQGGLKLFKDGYYIADHDTSNPHYIRSENTSPMTLNGAVIEGGKNAVAGDLWLGPNGTPGSVMDFTCHRLLGLPSAEGKASGAITIFGASANNAKIRIERCTLYHQDGNNAIAVSETGSLPAGNIIHIRSTLVWAKPDSTPLPLKTWDNDGAAGTPVEDRVPPAGANYNAGWNTREVTPLEKFTNEGRGYGGKFSVTPGADDVDGVDPQFVDTTRCLAVFASRALGETADEWAGSTAYAVGDVVARSVSGFYGGQTVLYQCIAAHTSAAETAPGSGASWRTNWIYRSFWAIADGMMAGNLGLIDQLYEWVRAGFAPRNSAYLTGGHDGSYIGAVPPFVSAAANRGLRAGTRGWWWRRF